MKTPKKFIYDMHISMKENNVLFAFTGDFDMTIINTMTRSIRQKLKEIEPAARVQKRVYNIIVECLESIFRNYQEAQSRNKTVNQFAIFTLGKSDDHYYFTSGNYIYNDMIAAVKETIDKINRLSLEEKKTAYRDIITKKEININDPNLAMIDIAIKSEGVLDYEFQKVNNETSFYIFEIKIKSN